MTPEQMQELNKYLESPMCPNAARELLVVAKKTDEQSVRILAEKLAIIIVRDGFEQAVGFLRGYWYATGTRNYDATALVAAIMGFNIRNGDLDS